MPTRAELGLPEHYPSIASIGVNPETGGPMYIGHCACRTWDGPQRTTQAEAWEDTKWHHPWPVIAAGQYTNLAGRIARILAED